VLGAADGVLGPYMGTCTQGSDDHILSATIVAGTLEGLGGLGLLLSRRVRSSTPALLICGAGLLFQIAWAGTFAVRHASEKISACSFVGFGDFDPTGSEGLIAFLWVLPPILVLTVIALRLRKALRPPVTD
jgi:hypothetical protein